LSQKHFFDAILNKKKFALKQIVWTKKFKFIGKRVGKSFYGDSNYKVLDWLLSVRNWLMVDEMCKK